MQDNTLWFGKSPPSQHLFCQLGSLLQGALTMRHNYAQVSKMLPNILEMLLNSSRLTTTELLFCNSPIPEKNIKPNLLIDCLFFIVPSLTDSGFSALFPPHWNPGGIKLSFMWAMQIQFNSLQLIKTTCSHPDRANKNVFVVWTWILILPSPLCSFLSLNVGISSLKAP